MVKIHVRMPTFIIPENSRRAIRWVSDGRRTPASRKEVKAFIQAAVDRSLKDLMYRWEGPKVSEAEANGADPSQYSGTGSAVPTKDELATAAQTVAENDTEKDDEKEPANA